MSENGEIYTAGKKFTLPPAVTAWTNLTSAPTPLNPFLITNITTLRNLSISHPLRQIDRRLDKRTLADLKGKDFRMVEDPREDYITTQQGQELARELK